MTNWKLPFGPGALVAAAFIGPGTVTTCTLAGANFGYGLLWALVFATFSAIILQSMSARLGVVTGQGLGANLVRSLNISVIRWFVIGLVLSALFVGNAAYEAGNISGAALGMQAALGGEGLQYKLYIVIISIIAATLLLLGKYKVIEKFLIGVVLMMCASFLVAAFIIRPDIGALLAGLKPSIPVDGSLMVLALIGTTVVPYNLFLHASAASERWSYEEGGLKAAKTDTFISIGLGGLISILILSTAASSLFGSAIVVKDAADMAVQLEPAFGPFARWLIAVGLFAAGLSSAITAPMATAYAVNECFRKEGTTQSIRFKVVAMIVLVVGASIGMLGIKPVEVILFAQFANGLLLPVIAGFLLYAMNRREMLGDHVNSLIQNILGGGVMLIAILLGGRSLYLVTDKLFG